MSACWYMRDTRLKENSKAHLEYPTMFDSISNYKYNQPTRKYGRRIDSNGSY